VKSGDYEICTRARARPVYGKGAHDILNNPTGRKPHLLELKFHPREFFVRSKTIILRIANNPEVMAIFQLLIYLALCKTFSLDRGLEIKGFWFPGQQP
jgi:hypothetical protein